MTKTEYLYGVKPSNYKQIQEQLCNEKIKDAKALMSILRKQPYSKEIEIRYIKVEEAINWNRKLIEELYIEI